MAALWTAVTAGAAYVDVELLAAGSFFGDAPSEGARAASPSKIILSSHNYERVPSDAELADVHARCVAAGADIVKIAAMAGAIRCIRRAILPGLTLVL